jgi:cell division GTPase FtsZ
LRQANIHFLGSGQGSVTAAGILEVLPSLADEIDKGTFTIDVVTRPLSEVEETWTESPGRAMQRVVFAPVR